MMVEMMVEMMVAKKASAITEMKAKMMEE